MLSRDITDRKRTEAALRQSEEHLQLALNAGEISTWSSDLGSGFIGSENYERLLGIAPGTFGGSFQDFLACIHPDEREYVQRAYEEAMRDRSSLEIEFRVLQPDGTLRWFASKGRFFYNETGEPIRVSGAIVAITDRKKAEESLLQSDTRLRLAVEASNIGLWDWTLATNNVFFSREWKRQIGLENEIASTFSEWEARLPERPRAFLCDPTGQPGRSKIRL